MRRWVLAGAGHAHALVLRGPAQQPVHGVEVVASPEALAPYAGAVAGWLAGRDRFDVIADRPPAAGGGDRRALAQRRCRSIGARWAVASP